MIIMADVINTPPRSADFREVVRDREERRKRRVAAASLTRLSSTNWFSALQAEGEKCHLSSRNDKGRCYSVRKIRPRTRIPWARTCIYIYEVG